MTLRLNGSTSGYVEIDAPAVAGSGLLTLPTGSGTVATEVFAAGAGGLVHINTTTFTTQSTVSINNVFTSTYDNYRILMNITAASTGLVITSRMRVASVDNSAAIYDTMAIGLNNATAFSARDPILTSFNICSTNSPVSVSIDVYNPFLTQNTVFQAFTGPNVEQTGVSNRMDLRANIHRTATSFDGVTFAPSSGTISGTIRIYGFKNS